MPEIQGYLTGSKTSELFEATITTSGNKAFVDTNSPLSGFNTYTGDNDFVNISPAPDGGIFTSSLKQEKLLEDVLQQLKLIVRYHELMTNTTFDKEDIENDNY